MYRRIPMALLLFTTDEVNLMPLGSLTRVWYGTKILITHHKVDQK